MPVRLDPYKNHADVDPLGNPVDANGDILPLEDMSHVLVLYPPAILAEMEHALAFVSEKARTQHGAKSNAVHESDGRFGSGGGSAEAQPKSVTPVRAMPISLDTLMKEHADVLLAVQKGIFGNALHPYTGDMVGNVRTAVVFHMQGFDGKPAVVGTPAFNTYVKNGATEMLRGVTSTDFAEQLKSGSYFAGEGAYGNGTYAAYGEAMQEIATRYAGSDNGVIVRMALAPDANVVSQQDAENGYETWVTELEAQETTNRRQLSDAMQTNDSTKIAEFQRTSALLKGADDLVHDWGVWAALQGFDALLVEKQPYYVLLNRTMLTFDKGTNK